MMPTQLCIRASSTVGQLVNKDAARKQQSLFAKLGGAPAVNAAVVCSFLHLSPNLAVFMHAHRDKSVAVHLYVMKGPLM